MINFQNPTKLLQTTIKFYLGAILSLFIGGIFFSIQNQYSFFLALPFVFLFLLIALIGFVFNLLGLFSSLQMDDKEPKTGRKKLVMLIVNFILALITFLVFHKIYESFMTFHYGL